MIEKPFVTDYEDDLEAFRRLSPRERIEQLTLKLDTDAAFVARFTDDFQKWEQQEELDAKEELYNRAKQEESVTRKSMYKFLLHGSSGVTDN